MTRLFVAMDFPGRVTEELSNLCHGVQGARWTSPEQMHLTLKFIGEVEDELVGEIEYALEKVRGIPLDLTVSGVGYFPPRKNPRVLWAGIPPSKELSRLQKSIESAIESAGVKCNNRRFHPHITLARLGERMPGSSLVPFLTSNSLFSTGTITIDMFHLYSSRLRPDGAIHTIESSYPLEDYCTL